MGLAFDRKWKKKIFETNTTNKEEMIDKNLILILYWVHPSYGEQQQ